MLVGDYFITIEDQAGNVLAEKTRTAHTGYPHVGHEILLDDGKLYRVVRLRHEDEPESFNSRQHTFVRVWVRMVDEELRVQRTEVVVDPLDEMVPPFMNFAEAMRRGVRCVILPAPLVGALVAVGYRYLATAYRLESRSAGVIVRDGWGWHMEKDQALLLRAHKRAGRHWREALALANHLAERTLRLVT